MLGYPQHDFMKKYAPYDCINCKKKYNCEGTLVHKKQECNEFEDEKKII